MKVHSDLSKAPLSKMPREGGRVQVLVNKWIARLLACEYSNVTIAPTTRRASLSGGSHRALERLTIALRSTRNR